MNATPAIVEARRAHSSRCRQRVITALNDAVTKGEEISVSAIGRKAGVDRSFFYRHRDLHAQVMAKAAEPPASPAGGPAVSRASLIADLANAHERIARLTQHNQQLQQRLSELLGEQAWQQSGLGAPPDIEALQRQITDMEQHNAELRRELSERGEELEAARAANRELITRLNRPEHTRAEDKNRRLMSAAPSPGELSSPVRGDPTGVPVTSQAADTKRTPAGRKPYGRE